MWDIFLHKGMLLGRTGPTHGRETADSRLGLVPTTWRRLKGTTPVETESDGLERAETGGWLEKVRRVTDPSTKTSAWSRCDEVSNPSLTWEMTGNQLRELGSSGLRSLEQVRNRTYPSHTSVLKSSPTGVPSVWPSTQTSTYPHSSSPVTHLLVSLESRSRLLVGEVKNGEIRNRTQSIKKPLNQHTVKRWCKEPLQREVRESTLLDLPRGDTTDE